MKKIFHKICNGILSRVRSNNLADFKNVPSIATTLTSCSPTPHTPHTKIPHTPDCSLHASRSRGCVWCVVCGAYDKLQFELKIQEKRKTKTMTSTKQRGFDFLTSSIYSNHLIHLKISFHHPSEN